MISVVNGARDQCATLPINRLRIPTAAWKLIQLLNRWRTRGKSQMEIYTIRRPGFH